MGVGKQVINDSRKNRRVSSMDKQYDHHEGFFFNQLITDLNQWR